MNGDESPGEEHVKKLVVSLMICALTLAATSALANDLFGALAYSYDTGAWGWAVNYEYQEDANGEALAQCGECEIVMEFQNTCAALALGSDGAYGWAYGDDPDAVQQAAIDYCLEYGDGCEVANWACTER